MAVGILDTGVANVASMGAALKRLGVEVRVCAQDSDVDDTITHVVLPGVGAYGAVRGLRERGLDRTVLRVVESGTPLLAVCLGLQMLCEGSEEKPGVPGLGVIPGRCRALPRAVSIPHLGWNLVIPAKDGLIIPGAAAYANSYALLEAPEGWKTSWTVHGTRFVAAVERGNVLACQFHPELSGEWGGKLMGAWLVGGQPNRPSVGHESHEQEGHESHEQSNEIHERERGHGILGTHEKTEETSEKESVVGGRISMAGVRSIPDIRPIEGAHNKNPQETSTSHERPWIRWIPWLSTRRIRSWFSLVLSWVSWPGGGGEARRAPTMLMSRIIPCLDVCNGRVVKGVQFQSLRDVGDPATCAEEYERGGADEIVVLDIAAAPDGLGHRTDVVRAIRERVGIPLTVGGGVRSVEDARALLGAGADKVSVNTAAVKNPALVKAMAQQFGCQCVVVAIDAKRANPGWQVRTVGGREVNELDVVDWAERCVELGAGEILLTSWDRDGTRHGYDVELIEAVTRRVQVPVIASGGGGTAQDVLTAFEWGAHAVLAASIFHDRDMTVRDLKAFLRDRDVQVRL